MTAIRNRLAQAIYQAIIESDAVDPAQSAYIDAADAVLDELGWDTAMHIQHNDEHGTFNILLIREGVQE